VDKIVKKDGKRSKKAKQTLKRETIKNNQHKTHIYQ